MPEQLRYEDVAVGDEVSAETTVDEVQMFYFSAATNNGHRIHYDKPYATEVEGHPDLLVHGPLQVSLMAKTLTDWIGPAGRLVSISLQHRASVYPHEGLTFSATVAGVKREGDRGIVDLDLWGSKADGTVFLPGKASVSLPV